MTRPELEELDVLVREIIGPEKALLWWVTPNPMLGNIEPQMLAAWRPEQLATFIRDAHEALVRTPAQLNGDV
jgi:hypothetical protein